MKKQSYKKMINTDEKIYDCTVVGGGISGVSFTYYLKKAGKDVLLLDNKTKAGGQIQSVQSAAKPGYWFEMGAHTCYNAYANLLAIINEAGLRDLVQPLLRHSFVIYSRSRIKSIASEMSVFRMIPGCFKCFSANKAGKTVEGFFRPITGGRNYDNLFRHAFSAVICQLADDYPAEIFLKKRNTRDKTFPRKFSFKQGISSLIDAILNKYKIEHLQSAEIVDINRENDIFIIEVKDGKRYRSKAVALATDPKTSSALLKNIEPEISALLSTILLFQSESLNVIIPKEKLNIREIAGIIDLSGEFMSAMSRDLIPDERFRSFTFHFEKGKLKLSEMVNLVCKVLCITESDITEQKFMEHSLSARRLKDIDIEKKTDSMLKNKRVYLTGNYFKGLSIEDCVTRSKREAERFLT
jgi:protoporphyrinogen oxidase